MTGPFLVLSRVENQVFKSKFEAWDDVLAVDFTRTAENVSRKGADMKVCWQFSRDERDPTVVFFYRKFSKRTK